ncbi:mitochondrial 37S ribosomal protein nam9 [Puttea exsequens]|nr:mitochondrial 37S ribosomal protein nam9 [Puttea exsequens]
MIYPAYQLNPGDMFQVEPERVLYATGATKDKFERRAGRRIRCLRAKKKETPEDAHVSGSNESDQAKGGPSLEATESNQLPKESLKSLLAQAKTILKTPSAELTARRKQDLRAFQRTVKRSLSRPDASATESLDIQLSEIIAKMASNSLNASPQPKQKDIPTLSTPELQAEVDQLTKEQLVTLRAALQEARENPIDESKPYATPWRPRPWMSPFVFIPRYLEVNQKICSAVYVRHPVARPGLGELPTPFGQETNMLAHNWYLRRR